MGVASSLAREIALGMFLRIRSAARRFAGEERGQGFARHAALKGRATGFPFAGEDVREIGESFTEFAAAEKMAGIAGAAVEGELIEGEGLEDQNAAGTQGALDGGKERALEIAEAEDYVEGGLGEREGFQVGAEQEKLYAAGGESLGELRGGGAADGGMVRMGQGFGAVERGDGNVDGGGGPAARGERHGILPCPAGEVEGVAAGEEGDGFDEKGTGRRGELKGWI